MSQGHGRMLRDVQGNALVRHRVRHVGLKVGSQDPSATCDFQVVEWMFQTTCSVSETS